MSRPGKYSPKKKVLRLEELCITEKEFKTYLELLCGCRLRNSYALLDNEWHERKGKWWPGLIKQHLLGERTVALRFNLAVNILILDLDNHGPCITDSVESRCRSIQAAFDAEALIYTSSDSGGLRMCYFLDQLYYKDDVALFAREKLEQAGMVIRSGIVEIRLGKTPDRLPFGKGSLLVDELTLNPQPELSLSAMIHAAESVKENHALSVKAPVRHKPQNPTMSKEERFALAGYLERYGLPATVSTNDALLALNLRLMGQMLLQADEASEWMKDWIRRRHNGYSRRVNTGRLKELDARIDRIVAGFKPTKFKGNRTKETKSDGQLSLGDVEQLCNSIEDQKVLRAAFSLLEYVKSRGKLVDPSELSEDRKLPALPTSICNYIVVGFQQVWRCEIPYTMLQKLDGFGKQQPNRMLRRLQSIGLVKPWLHHSREHHKAKTYLISFTFDNSTRPVSGVYEGLGLLFSTKELNRRFSRVFVSKIERERDNATRKKPKRPKSTCENAVSIVA